MVSVNGDPSAAELAQKLNAIKSSKESKVASRELKLQKKQPLKIKDGERPCAYAQGLFRWQN